MWNFVIEVENRIQMNELTKEKARNKVIFSFVTKIITKGLHKVTLYPENSILEIYVVTY